jgi:hypothetical protein
MLGNMATNPWSQGLWDTTIGGLRKGSRVLSVYRISSWAVAPQYLLDVHFDNLVASGAYSQGPP